MPKKFSLAILTAALCVAAPLTHAEDIAAGQHGATASGSTAGAFHRHHRGDSGDSSRTNTGNKRKKGTIDPIPDPPPQS